MKLPNLSELNMESNLEEFINQEAKIETKKEIKQENYKSEFSRKENKDLKKKSIIPKTQYDDEGNPVLAIPDLNDVDLKSELDRFFGNKGGR